MECYLLSEPKVRGSRKRMISLQLNKGMFWVSEQRLVDQGNTIRRNSWMNELEIQELERNLAENNDTSSNLQEAVRDILTALEANEEISNLEKEEVAIIEETAKALERRQKEKLPALRDKPKKKLFEEIVKIDNVLYKSKTYSITKTNELLYAGATVVINRLGIKINKTAQ